MVFFNPWYFQLFLTLTIAGLANFFSEFAYRTTVFIGMALLNAISLQMFWKKLRYLQQCFP